MKGNTSTLAVIGGLAVFGFLALAAVLMVSPGPESTQRLGLFFAVVASAVAALVALLKSDQAATQTNGTLDQRIEDGVHRALAGRRSTDGSIDTTRSSDAP
jgi:hypothetical protein